MDGQGIVVKAQVRGVKPDDDLLPATSLAARAGLRDDLAQQAGVPGDVAGDPSSAWGKSVQDIEQSFTMDGAIVTPKPARAVFTVEGSATGVVEFQYGAESDVITHLGAYYKVAYVDGSKAKIIDPESYKPTFKSDGQPQYDNDTVYFNPQGQKLTFNPSTNSWAPE